MESRPIAVTSGEPSGIGPDIVLPLFRERFGVPLTIFGDPDVLADRARMLGVGFDPGEFIGPGAGDGCARLVPVRAPASVRAGHPDPANAPHVLEQIDRAIDGCQSGEFCAMVTGPVNKHALSGEGRTFTGHTEHIRDRTGSADATMLFVNPKVRLGLATTHVPLSRVATTVTTGLVLRKIVALSDGLARWFGVERPRIRVAGLNPHAGEGGLLGEEDSKVIAPAVRDAAGKGLRVTGPHPADTVMLPGSLAETDAVLGMYHDQLLPAVKALDFHGTVNVTLGLPFARTSVDHGTAEDLAGTGRASPLNMAAAVRLAADLCGRRGRATGD